MSQSFSLYTELTVLQNLDLHARLFHLPKERAARRIDDLIRRFGLTGYVRQLASDLPLGIRQRLSLAVAVVHEPDVLILDEPTSGVDPMARDSFWELLIDLSRHQGVTIFVSTHFMNEAARCDRISLMDAGRVLATDNPEQSRPRARHGHARRCIHQLSRRGERRPHLLGVRVSISNSLRLSAVTRVPARRSSSAFVGCRLIQSERRSS